MRQLHALLLLGVLASAACSFDQTTNPNSPDPIGENPSRGGGGGRRRREC